MKSHSQEYTSTLTHALPLGVLSREVIFHNCSPFSRSFPIWHAYFHDAKKISPADEKSELTNEEKIKQVKHVVAREYISGGRLSTEAVLGGSLCKGCGPCTCFSCIPHCAKNLCFYASDWCCTYTCCDTNFSIRRSSKIAVGSKFICQAICCIPELITQTCHSASDWTLAQTSIDIGAISPTREDMDAEPEFKGSIAEKICAKYTELSPDMCDSTSTDSKLLRTFDVIHKDRAEKIVALAAVQKKETEKHNRKKSKWDEVIPRVVELVKKTKSPQSLQNASKPYFVSDDKVPEVPDAKVPEVHIDNAAVLPFALFAAPATPTATDAIKKTILPATPTKAAPLHPFAPQ